MANFQNPSLKSHLSDTLQALDWPKMVDLASNEAITELGKSLILDLLDDSHWSQSIELAKLQQSETSEIQHLLDRDALWAPLRSLPNPHPSLNQLQKKAVLEFIELVILRDWCIAIDTWVNIPREEFRGECLKKSLKQLPDLDQILVKLEKILTPEGTLHENATPTLALLSQQSRTQKKEIQQQIDRLLSVYSEKGILQDRYSDVRDGRYVLPIKISAQSQVPGILHEASVSKQTVFIEPRELELLNNKNRQLQNSILEETYKILSDVSKNLIPHAEELGCAVKILAHWDHVQAKARFGRKYGGKLIQIADADQRSFSLRQCAHPLLWLSLPPEKIVRNDLEFEPETHALILTGPNTGGKTVFLKTLGLAAVCAKTGFLFPGSERLKVPFFDSILADLGDPQSIDSHLSSFSGHIHRFKEILNILSPRTLILIDELNSATDPEEGSALGRAFLETMIQEGATVVTTTHDPYLKARVLSDTRILSASMEFDATIKCPTYHLRIGVPGQSRALETAERLGIPASVLQLARSYLSHEHLEFESLLSTLENEKNIAVRARKEAQELKDEALKLKDLWSNRIGTNVDELLSKTKQRLKRILEEAQDEVRSTVKKKAAPQEKLKIFSDTLANSAEKIGVALIQEAPELATTLKEIQTASELSGSGSGSGSKLEPVLGLGLERSEPYSIGMEVRIPKWKSNGTVLELLGNKVKVQMGALQMTLPNSELQPLGSEESRSASSSNKKMRGKVTFQASTNSAPPPSELDLRGVRFEDAMSQLERYLDEAFRSGSIFEVSIIHGLGSGAIREGTRKLLGTLPYIKAFRDGGPGRGGTGTTIIEFELS